MTDPQRLLTRMLVSAINAREQESDRVSRKLHDEVGQVLSAVGFQLDAMKLEFQERVPDIGEHVTAIQNLLDQAMKEVRALSYDLNPAVVERVGLQFALDRLVGRFRDRYEGSLRFLYDSSVRVPLDIANAWYKITEHALDNAVEHAKASRIEVHVRPTAKGTVLEVRDNGIGFKVGEVRAKCAGLGILLMEHYASQAGIPFEILSEPEQGTVVRCTNGAGAERPAKTAQKKTK